MGRAVIVSAAMVLAAVACTGRGDPTPPSAVPTTADAFHVVVDTDLAYDDVMALLYLLRRDDVVVDAVTIVGTGEVHCEHGVGNALSLLALGGSPGTPVACGRETPLLGSNAFPDAWRAGADDLSVMQLPEPVGEADPRGAVGLLLEEMDDETTLLTLGPLTNVAEALREDPDLPARVPAFVAMAGAVDVGGNAPNGVAEYNVWVDPLAAKEAFMGIPATLVPLDATNDVRATPFFLEALDRHRGTPESEAVYRLMDANKVIFDDPSYSFWDALTAVLLLEPELATWNKARVLITASQDAGAGWMDRWGAGTPVRFANGLPDPLAFEREYLSVLTGEEVTDVRPDPSLTVVFDGRRCFTEPPRSPAGPQVVAFENRSSRSATAILIPVTTRTYETLSDLLGPPGSPVPPEDSVPKEIRPIAWLVDGDRQEARLTAGTLAAACVVERRTAPALAWLSDPVPIG